MKGEDGGWGDGEEVEGKRSTRGYSWGLMGADDNGPAV